MSPRVALVTGGAQGIGEAIALRLAQDGLYVAILDVQGKAELMSVVGSKISNSACRPRSMWLVCDVTVEDEVKLAIERVVESMGRLDVMVANAGITMFKSLLDTTTEEWNRQLSVNATGTMLCYKYAALQMIKQGQGGRIIGACSGAGKKGILNMAAYSASKFAVRGLTQSTALELRPHKITVNSYAPGMILTQMIAHPDDETFGGHGYVAIRSIGMDPSEFNGAEPDVIAGLVSYLIKPEAWYITGQNINIDGGMTLD